MRLAAIDIGTNSVRMRVVEVPVGGARRTLDDEKAYTRIGRGLGATGRLSDEAVEETLDALRRMLSIAGQHGVMHVRAVATAAVRDASNADEFLARARDELGLDVDVISPEEEGRLAFLSAAESIGAQGPRTVIDIGGGSMEVVRATDGQIAQIASLPVGAVLMAERFHTTDPMPAEARERLAGHVRTQLAAALGDQPGPIGTLVGSGGTVSTAAALIAARAKHNLMSVHTFEIQRRDLSRLVASLARTSAAERLAMKGMPPSRVDIIVAGAIVLEEVMRFFGADKLTVNAKGMREGLVIDMVVRERGVEVPLDRMQAVRDFGRRFQTDQQHAEQVCRIALRLFDELGPRLGLGDEDRQLLEAAALLHDIGYHVSYERHHKHGYHLIYHSEIPGFASSEIRLIAAVVRYHRGSRPKARHEAMTELAASERKRVARLAALLRLADGLDRSRGQRVENMDIDTGDTALTITLCGAESLDVELFGARERADMLEDLLDARLDIIEGGAAASAVAPGSRQPRQQEDSLP